jgi:uncharacterized pyridoxamine 5'-phosphate oxidase family protein
MKKKIATITTKFDLAGDLKSNYSGFLKKQEGKWEDVLKDVTKREINRALKENYPINVVITDTNYGSVEMAADVSTVLNTLDTILDIASIIVNLAPYLKEIFAEGLNKEAEKHWEDQLPEGDIIDVEYFDIDEPADVNEQEQEE